MPLTPEGVVQLVQRAFRSRLSADPVRVQRGGVVFFAENNTTSIGVTADGTPTGKPFEVWRNGAWVHRGPWEALIGVAAVAIDADCDAAQDTADIAEKAARLTQKKLVDDAKIVWAAKVTP